MDFDDAVKAKDKMMFKNILEDFDLVYNEAADHFKAEPCNRNQFNMLLTLFKEFERQKYRTENN